MCTTSNPFRSTADMVADGTVRRPTYLDVDSPLAGVAVAAPAPRPLSRNEQPRAASEFSPVAAAVAKQAAADQKRRVASPDRVGRLLH
jgi:hypothetical protein